MCSYTLLTPPWIRPFVSTPRTDSVCKDIICDGANSLEYGRVTLSVLPDNTTNVILLITYTESSKGM